jgi:RNA polymerase sigma-70 factor (ECF subfamily)
MDQKGDVLHLEDVAWAKELAAGDRAALARYEADLTPMVTAQLRRRGLSDDAIADVQQTLRMRLFGEGAIARYEGRASLKSWVLISALREANRVREKAAREPATNDDDLIGLADRDAGVQDADKQRYRDLFKQAFRDALTTLSPRDRVLLRMHVLDGLTIDQIGVLQSVHRATAARWVERARETLSRHIRRELMTQLGTDPFETTEMMAWMQSRIDLSLSVLGHES